MKTHRSFLFAIVFSLLGGSAQSQLNGVYSVPGSFTSIANAISSLNTFGITGPVTINIAVGYTETTIAGGYSLYPVVGSTSLNTVTFQKSGTGADPIIYANTGVATASYSTQDGIWRLIGADYITINGIDLFDANTGGISTMEFGYGLFKYNATNGCQFNTIKNCSIKLSRSNNFIGILPALNGSRGIDVVNATPDQHTTALTITSTSGANSQNKFYSNTIYDCHTGISIMGYSSPLSSSFSDLNNDIGGAVSVTGNTITNFGGGGTLTPASGIQTSAQFELNVSNNFINNNTGSGTNHQAILRGIYLNNATGANVTLVSNTVGVRGGASTVQVSGIENAAGTNAAGNTITIFNNVISGCSNTVNTTGVFYGIWNSAPADQIVMSGNTFTNNTHSASTGSVFLIYNTGQANNSIDMSANNLSYSITTGYSGNLFSITNTHAGTYSTNVTMNYNSFSNYYYSNTTGYTGYIRASGTNSTIAMNNNTWNSLSYSTQGYSHLLYNNSNSQAAISVCNNSIVAGFTMVGSGPGVTCYFSGGFPSAASGMTCTGNNFSNVTNTVLNTSSFQGFLFNDISPAPYARKLVYGNVISNINMTGASFLGIAARYLGEGSVSAPSSIYNNTITNVSCWYTAYGIMINDYASPTFKPQIYSNYIDNISAASPGDKAYGIFIYGPSTGADIFRNKITNIIHTGNISSQAFGLHAEGTASVSIFNNIIGGIAAPNSTNGDAATGIDLAPDINGAYGTYKIYYNSVFMNGSSYGSNAINTATASYVDIKNNIFVNLSTPAGTGITTSFRRGTGNLNRYDLSSNNNLFYAGVPASNNALLKIGATNYTSMTTLKAILSSREWNSVTENPPFLSIVPTSVNYLAINAGTPTQIESGAMPIAGITNDFFGNPRNPSFPDIGAIEGPYTPTLGDLIAPTINGSGFSSPLCNTAVRIFTAALSDLSGTATGSLSPRVYYKVNTGPYVSVPGNLSSGTTTLGIWTFSLTYTATYSDVISCFLVAQDNSGSGNLMAFPPGGFSGTSVNTIVTVPTSPLTFTIYNTLGGTYTVGAGGTFTTLTDAASAYNTSCLTGPVTFVLTDLLYSPNETFPITFLNNTGASATNSLLIKPATGVSAVIQRITNNNPSTTIKLLDARFISFDGINNSGSSLTVINTNTFTYPSAGIWLSSGGSGNNNITLNNITFRALSSAYSYGILATEDGSVVPQSQFTTNGGKDNDFITVKRNTFLRQGYGIAIFGASVSPVGGNDNWDISDNQIGPVIPSVENLLYNGIQLRNVLQTSVTNNTISNIYNANYPPIGINMLLGISNFTIDANTIRSIKSNGTAGLGGVAICINTGFNFSNILVKNNMACDLMGDARTTFTLGGFAGISVGLYNATGGIKFYHNSIAINQGTASPGYTTNCVSAAIYFSPMSDNIELRDNIFYSNVQMSTYTTSTTYALYSHAPASAFNVMNHNSYVVSGTQGTLAYLNGNLNSLSALKNAFGQNINSISMLPAFTSSLDLHIDASVLSNYFFDNLGAPIPGTSLDIDNQSRNLSTPDIGCDEFNPLATCTTASGGNISSSPSICMGSTLTLNSGGASGGVGTTYQWQVSPIPGGTYTNVSTGSNATTTAYNIGTYPPGTYYFVLKTTCSTLSLTNLSNESTLTVMAPPVLSVSAPSIACAGNTVVLTASGANTFTWSNGTLGSVNTITPTAAGNYYVIGTNSPCANIQSQNMLVYYAPAPILTITTPSPEICTGKTSTLIATGAATYTWNNGAQTSSILVSPSSTNLYMVIGTNSTGCSNQAQQTITVNPMPSVTISGNPFVCLGSSIILTAAGATTYTWNTGSTSAALQISPGSNTTYSLLGKDLKGCEGTATKSVVVLPLPVITAQASITVVCAGKQVSLFASGALSYNWSGGIQNGVPFSPAFSSAYMVTGTDGNGCQSTASINIVVNPLPNIAIITLNNVICSGETGTLTVTGASTYTWNTGENSNSITVVPPGITTYTVIGTDVNGCSKATTFTQLVDDCTGLAGSKTSDGLMSLYPNPNEGFFNINVNTFSCNILVIIKDELGQIVYCKTIEGTNTPIDLSKQGKGIYILSILDGINQIGHWKIVKQ